MKPIGQLLKEAGCITEEHIRFALVEQQATGERLGEILVRLGLVTDAEIAQVLAQQSNLPFIDLANINPEKRALLQIPSRFAREAQVLPFKLENGVLHVAIADPFDRRVREALLRHTQTKIELYVAPKSQIQKTVEHFYYLLQHPPREEINNLLDRLKRNPTLNFDVDQLFQNLMIEAINVNAADIHFVPYEKTFRVYYRVDGLLELAFVFPAPIHGRLINAVKIRAGMDIAEQRLPQDGKMRFEFLGEEFDLRISTVRGLFGENMVIRLLPIKASIRHLISLGFDQEEVKALEELFTKPNGMVLVTGPTGSGKTTTLYAALRLVDAIKKNVLTAEDPVEYYFPLIRQTQINEDIGYTFAQAIRHFLRQDPDVILVGEIRDEETAQMAVRAALTGHLLLSTLHTNDAVSAIERLRDLGITNFLLAGSLLGVTAQRLLRRLCPHCLEEYRPSPELLEKYGLPHDATYFRGKGCEICRGKGFLGRTAVTEILLFDEEIKELIAKGVSTVEIKKVAVAQGMKTLWDSAKKRILAGETTVEEAVRVLG
ncbi:type II secretion system protein E [Thermodesulfatator indicus DSM 15286]|uniref:Type II secretion system protein E n=1 Tax=Thermodesulfatator indicus (strain DSM 15286 / JCM 11887 / CIR29812) TaxID=667014 RepID=F8ACA7_THEID|nr:GspE/PulE family protein [Thermodesulfatator indicus]AEH45742.1 type II secretion system protein E [Thermodesulfatator indicus DSM 15286]